ncbi:hypothetical protein SAMN05444156_2240 [Verrucomicrobium sp. GAS474]|uniref:hypothetical protein n=1 Tax=Verrucomicrobium sp. GAS474 TaxID=1882831 RepID=UPI00087B2EA4|nr:hypothetical protein [Verrucomicrobium sp. GAS474]SDU14694.1 hypothetical protein SAMN05444156_2240 [Verrucomicrobium sp. GAS474]
MKHPAPSAALVDSRRIPLLTLVALVGGGILLFAPLSKAHAGLFTDETAKAKEEMAPVADSTLTRASANLDQIEADITAAEKNLRQGVAAQSSADVDIASYTSAQTGLQKRLDDVSADLAAIDKKQSYLQGSHKLDEKTDLLTQAQREKVGLLQGRRQSDLSRLGSMEAMIKMASTHKDELAKAERRSATHAQALADAQASQAAATASGAHTNQAADYSSATVAVAEPQPAPQPAPPTTVIVQDSYSPPVYYYNGYNPYYPPPYYYYGRPGYYYGPSVGLDFRFGGGGHHHH